MDNLPSKWTLRFTAKVVAILCVGLQITSASAQVKSSIAEFGVKKPSPLTINCIAEPGLIRPGEVSRIVATAVSAQNRPLTYDYAASVGSIKGVGTAAWRSSAWSTIRARTSTTRICPRAIPCGVTCSTASIASSSPFLRSR